MADVVVGRDKCGEQRLVSLPLSRIRVIMKSSPEVSSINQEALVLTAKATVRRRPRGKEREDSGVGGRLKLSRCPVPVGPRAVGAPLRAHACATLREPTQFHAARASAPARPPSLCSALPAPLPSCLAHLSPRPPRSRPASRALRPAHPAPLPPALARQGGGSGQRLGMSRTSCISSVRVTVFSAPKPARFLASGLFPWFRCPSSSNDPVTGSGRRTHEGRGFSLELRPMVPFVHSISRYLRETSPGHNRSNSRNPSFTACCISPLLGAK